MSLPLSLKTNPRALPSADVIAVFSEKKKLPVPAAVARVAGPHLARAGFKWGPLETHTVPLPGRAPRKLFVIGQGDAPSLGTFRHGIAAAIQYAKAEGLQTVAVLAPERFTADQKMHAGIGRAFAEGALLANYRFTTYRAEQAKRERTLRLTRVELCIPEPARAAVREGIQRGTIEAEGTMLARTLVNEPSSIMTPQALVERAQAIAKASKGAITLTVWNRAECAKRGMEAFLAVARGSVQEPAFLHLTYRQGRAEEGAPRVVLIGKGITFDSGGLSIKPSDGMETMKLDMAGAASVLGVFAVLTRWQPAVEVHGMIAACENMPSGSATKPGDIVRTVSGKTIEILNTDAEGRLTLADALGEAVQLAPTAIIDLATLTGACMVALGEEISGLWSNDDALAGALLRAAEEAGEAVWRMPLFREYRGLLRSEMADMKNITGRRYGGAITAALFLKEFVGAVPWAHLDIAGPGYAERQTSPINPVGGTGFGVRTVLHYLERLGAGA